VGDDGNIERLRGKLRAWNDVVEELLA